MCQFISFSLPCKSFDVDCKLHQTFCIAKLRKFDLELPFIHLAVIYYLTLMIPCVVLGPLKEGQKPIL